MTPEFLLKVANVLDVAADAFDAQETEKIAVVKIAQDAMIKDLSDKYLLATGEEIPAEVLTKLSSSGEGVLSSVKQLLEKTAGNTEVDRLGRTSEKVERQAPRNKHEAAAEAYDRFGQYLVS